MKKNKLVYWLLAIALVAAVYLVTDRTRERTVGQVCPELKEATACSLFTTSAVTDGVSKTLEGEELDAFVRYLSQTPCRRENKRSDFEGQLYHVFLSGEGGAVKDIQLTSAGYMEIGLKDSYRAYSFQPEELCAYLDSVLAA